jgi:uncharacterized membrane protein HdeD (DUF308 family)
MSDVSQGPGWWLASDGKWYPPESHLARIAGDVPEDDRKRSIRIWGGIILIVLGIVQISTGASKDQAGMIFVGVIVVVAGAGFIFLSTRAFRNRYDERNQD